MKWNECINYIDSQYIIRYTLKKFSKAFFPLLHNIECLHNNFYLCKVRTVYIYMYIITIYIFQTTTLCLWVSTFKNTELSIQFIFHLYYCVYYYLHFIDNKLHIWRHTVLAKGIGTCKLFWWKRFFIFVYIEY